MRGSVRSTRARTAPIPRSRLFIAVLVFAAVVATGARVEAGSLPLTWNAPTTNADGTALTDLGNYRIYIGTSAPACPGASFHTVSSPTSSPTSGQTVSTRITALAAGTTYFVRVTATDTAGNESACSASASGAALSDYTVAPTGTTNFGTVAINTTVDRTFTVQNTSAASISVTASVGAPFSVVSGSSFSLAAGASQAVTVRFKPTTSGSFAGNVNFTASGDTISRAVSGSASGTTTQTFALTVTKSGTGSGTVTSVPAGIACGTDCSETLAGGTAITLTATPATGSVFAGWSGACSGTATTCAWTMSQATAVSATFNTSSGSTSPPGSTTPPATPGTPSVTMRAADASAVTFDVAWAAASGATSYRYAAAYNDGSALQQGSVTGLLSFQLRMPYTASGAASTGFVCIRAVSASGLTSADQACNTVPVPARPPAPPAPVVSGLAPTSAAVGSAGITLTVNGSGFVSSSSVRWNGSARPTTFVSATQLRATIAAADLANAGSVPISVVTPAPGGGTSGTQTFTVTTAQPSTPPGAPGPPSVTLRARDTSGVTFGIAWSAGSGATSYRYVAAFNDGSAAQEGTVTSTSLQLRMPYHRSGGAFSGFVCIRSVNAAGLSADQSCNALAVPAP